MARDVTAHRRGLEAIAATEARSTAMIDILPLLVWLKDTSGRFIAVNQRFAQSCGRERAADVLGKTDLDVWPRELAEQYRADDAEIMRRGEQKQVEEPISREGVITWFETFKAPVYDDTGKLLGTTGFARDITKRKAAEEERRRIEAQVEQSHKMEVVGQLAGGVAHDFNNLLSLIIGYADFALDELPVESPVRADLLEVKKAGERAVGLTRQLLSFSRKHVLERRRIHTNDALNNLTKMLRRLIGENIIFELNLAPDARAIFADPVQLDQVITNIAINARDAMPGGGKLVISTRNVAQGERRAQDWPDGALGDYVRISISDTGTGIPKDILGRIFEPFFTTKERGKGTGLGLSMVYGAVQQNGGHLSVDSEVGRGTTFRVYLPAANAEAKETADAESVVGLESKGETVLVVEDDDAVRRALVRILRSAGYHVLDANGGAEALALFGASAGTIALVITDVIMPGMSGPALAAALEHTKPGVEILFCSGYPDDLPTAESGRHGGDRLISKPIEKRALLRKIREILGT